MFRFTIVIAKAEAKIYLIHKLSNTASSSLNGMKSRLIDKGPNFGNIETFMNQLLMKYQLKQLNEKQINISPNGVYIVPKDNKSWFFYIIHHVLILNGYLWRTMG